METKRLNVEVHEKLMEEIKVAAAKAGISIKVLITRAILKELHRRKEEEEK